MMAALSAIQPTRTLVLLALTLGHNENWRGDHVRVCRVPVEACTKPIMRGIVRTLITKHTTCGRGEPRGTGSTGLVQECSGFLLTKRPGLPAFRRYILACNDRQQALRIAQFLLLDRSADTICVESRVRMRIACFASHPLTIPVARTHAVYTRSGPTKHTRLALGCSGLAHTVCSESVLIAAIVLFLTRLIAVETKVTACRHCQPPRSAPGPLSAHAPRSSTISAYESN